MVKGNGNGDGHGHRPQDAGVCGTSVPVNAAVTAAFTHRLRFTRDVLHPANAALREVVGGADETPGRMLAFVDQGVADAWPDLAERLERYLAAAAPVPVLAAPPITVPGGEAAKNDWSVFETVARAIHDGRLCRHSYVLAIGGGAVLDAVGFAAATAHRGVRLVRLPTTTLAQCDSGVGVKNGINAFGKKNFLGTFAVPWAVINDERFLGTLSMRDWRCGLSEAVKVALLKDAALLDLSERRADRLAGRDAGSMRPVVRRSAELHLAHIVTGGDPFEAAGIRPLDFGHWSAHKLEILSGFEVRHGEAVAIGVALDVLYSAMTGSLPGSDAERVLSILRGLGFSLYHERLADPALFDGLEEFREHLGGRLAITLLGGIGRPFDCASIDRRRMEDAIAHLAAIGATV